MTETEWLASTDPAAMLAFLTLDFSLGKDRPGPKPSARKLRLFACACWWGFSANLGRDAEAMLESEGYISATIAAEWAMAWAGDQIKPSPAERAALLREIVGNLFRPVTRFHPPEGCGVQGHDLECVGCGEKLYGRRIAEVCPYPACPWLTPTVLGLATAAYDERAGRKCERCGGSGEHSTKDYHGAWDTSFCPDCHGAGTVSDGTLDPDRLAVLSDALEEAGCDCWEILAHLRNLCPRTSAAGWHYDMIDPTDCPHCSGEGIVTRPHVRGCWALDLLLGKE